jgi:hypothetical protein
MIKFFKNGLVSSNKGISIVLAIIIIIVLGLAGSIFAYLTSSGNITSRSNLTSAAAKYAAKSGVEITMWEIKNVGSGAFSSSPLPGCPASPIIPPLVNRTLTSGSYFYLSGNLQGGPGSFLETVAPGANYTPTFCAVYGSLNGGKINGCDPYVITSNGFAGGTEREVTAEVSIKGNGEGNCTGIYVETELPNG